MRAIVFEKYPKTAVNYITFLSEKIRFLNKKLNVVSSSGTENTVFKYLTSLADKNGEIIHSDLNSDYVSYSEPVVLKDYIINILKIKLDNIDIKIVDRKKLDDYILNKYDSNYFEVLLFQFQSVLFHL